VECQILNIIARKICAKKQLKNHQSKQSSGDDEAVVGKSDGVSTN
jgi:hypothetical protein